MSVQALLLAVFSGLFFAAPSWATASEAGILAQRANDLLARQKYAELLPIAEELRRRFPDSDEAAAALFWRARALESTNDFEGAYRAYDEFVKSRHISVNAHEARIKRSLLREALRGRERGALPMMLRALNLRSRRGGAEAIATLRELVREQPDSILADDALHLLAYIELIDRDNPLSAERLYRELMNRYPRTSYLDSAEYGLAFALEKQGDIEGAASRYERLKDKHTSFNLVGLAFPRDSFVSRIWFKKAGARLAHLESRQAIVDDGSRLLRTKGFMFGLGDRLWLDAPVGSGRNFRSLSGHAREYGLHPQHLVHWVTRQTDWRWERPDRLLAASRSGHTPVVVSWFFGDQISPAFVRRHRHDYIRHLQHRVVPLIKDVPDVILLLEPEFNKNGIEAWADWDALMTRAVNTVKRGAPNARVGITLGSWVDVANQDLDEMIGDTVAASDFVAVQEMISVHDSNSALDPAWDPLHRTLSLTQSLQRQFQKPIYVAYLAVSTFGDWSERQATLISRFDRASEELAGYGVFGVGYFSLFDDRQHDGWFGEAERQFGLVAADNRPKPALAALKNWQQRLRTLDERPPSLTRNFAWSAKRLDLTRGSATATAVLDEWARWRVEVVGKRSGARREFSGTGRRIRFNWDGVASVGSFEAEACQIVLTAMDASGNKTRRELGGTCDIVKPRASSVHLRLEAGEDLAHYPWGEARTSAAAQTLSMQLGSAYAGVAVPFDVAGPVDIDPDGALRVELTATPGQLEGLAIALDDADGARRAILLQAYVAQDADGTRQTVVIPMADFERIGSDKSGMVSRSGRRLAWKRMRAVVFTNLETPASVQIHALEVLRRQATASARTRSDSS